MNKELSRRNFILAAIFGSIAGTAIVKGGVVAGNAFKGGVYSSFSDPPLKLTVEEGSPWLGEMLKAEIEKNKHA
jgi:hypothetical protein